MHGPRNRGVGRKRGMCPPPWKKCCFSGLKCPIHFKKKEKSISWKNARLLLERKWAFCRSKDSVKAISDVIETTHVQKFVRHANDIKLFDSGHVQNCPFLSMPLHFRNACAPLLLFGISLCTCWLISNTLCEINDGKMYARRCCRGIYF
jgi:hypothetical protein